MALRLTMTGLLPSIASGPTRTAWLRKRKRDRDGGEQPRERETQSLLAHGRSVVNATPPQSLKSPIPRAEIFRELALVVACSDKRCRPSWLV